MTKITTLLTSLGLAALLTTAACGKDKKPSAKTDPAKEPTASEPAKAEPAVATPAAPAAPAKADDKPAAGDKAKAADKGGW